VPVRSFGLEVPVRFSLLAGLAALLVSASAYGAPPTLSEAFASAWARQPEALADPELRAAATARSRAATSPFAESPAVVLREFSDRWRDDVGAREVEVELEAPIRLPGAWSAARNVASADEAGYVASLDVTKLQVAGEVRMRWADARAAVARAAVAGRRAAAASALAEDVQRRVRAGEMSRAEGNQTDGAARLAEAELHTARAAAARALRAWQVYTGLEQLPEVAESVSTFDAEAPHPAVVSASARSDAAAARARMASVERVGMPELTLGMRRERPASGVDYEDAILLGVRMPIGGFARQRATVAAARGEAAAAAGTVERSRALVDAERASARAALDAAQAVERLAAERDALARETLQLYTRAFALGEIDLATRLRVQNERYDAEFDLEIARIENARAISALNQAIGVLP
jgi:cobalt-zinc-cadmium efflux system outer membrane protein